MEIAAARQWAEQWVDDWNRHDVEAVLAQFADDVEFSSPLVVQVMGHVDGVVRGKEELRAYWTTALAARPDLHFELVDVHTGAGCLAVRYRNQAGRLATEVEVFGDGGTHAGLVVRGWVLYEG
jgi:ketosteroid isomerase-like protein